MDYSRAVLGKTIADQLQTRTGAAILRIGTDAFTRGDLAGVACFNFQAAQTLSAILNNGLQVKDTRAVFETVAPADLALPRIGAIALAVLGAAFEVHRLGGAAPLEAWVRKHAGKGGTVQTFATFKQHARDRQPSRRSARRGRRRNGR
jgi:hypothetical protein